MSCPQSFESFLEKLLKEHPDLDAISQSPFTHPDRKSVRFLPSIAVP
jgi:hypothetical protein